ENMPNRRSLLILTLPPTFDAFSPNEIWLLEFSTKLMEDRQRLKNRALQDQLCLFMHRWVSAYFPNHRRAFSSAHANAAARQGNPQNASRCLRIETTLFLRAICSSPSAAIADGRPLCHPVRA